jgi:tetratricopeptide (TPR) repeat protein
MPIATRPARIGGAALASICALLLAANVAAQDPEWLQRAQELLASDPPAALAMADDEIAAATRAGQASQRFHAHFGRADLLRRLGRYTDAVLDLEHTLAHALESGDRTLEARALAALGVAYVQSGLYPDALDALTRALDLSIGLGEWTRASAVLNNLGNLFSEHGDNEAARDYYQRSLAMKREHGIEEGIAGLLSNLGDLDLVAGDLALARLRLEEAAELSRLRGPGRTEALARINLGRTLVQMGEFRSALDQLDRAEGLAAGEEVRVLAAVHHARAGAYLALARAEPEAVTLREPRLQRALDSATRAEAIAATIDDPGRRAAIAERTSEIHAELGQPDQALAWLRRSSEQLREREQRAEGARQAELAARFQHAQHRSEITELRARVLRDRAQLERQRTLALLLGGGTIALALLAVLLLRQARQRRHHAIELRTRNVELGDALLEVEQQRARAERLSAVNRQLLAAAGSDLRTPLLQIRANAERLLVELHGEGRLERQVAAIAQSAGELVRVVEQISQLARPVERADRSGPGCDVPAVLDSVIEQVDPRLPGRERRLRVLVDHPGAAFANVEGRGLDRVLHELLDAVLRRNPGKASMDIGISQELAAVMLRIDDPAGDVVGSLNAGDGGIGLAFAGKVLRELGGELSGEAHGRVPRVVVRLPAAMTAAPSLAADEPSDSVV